MKVARLRELRAEMLRSKQLKDFFEANPRDLTLLRHDSVLHPSAVQPQLKHVPDYLGEFPVVLGEPHCFLVWEIYFSLLRTHHYKYDL